MFYTIGEFAPFVLVFLAVVFIIIIHTVASAGRDRRRRVQDGPQMHGQHEAFEAFDDDQTPCPPRDTFLRGASAAGGWDCAGPECLAVNPAHGRFCRMCGRRRT